MNLGEKIKMLMKEKNLRKSDLSRETGIPYTTLDGILKRDDFSKVKLDTVQLLKNYFDVTLDYLMIDEITDKNYGKQNKGNLIMENSLMSKESTLIEKYRELAETDQTKVDDYVDKLHKLQMLEDAWTRKFGNDDSDLREEFEKWKKSKEK